VTANAGFEGMDTPVIGTGESNGNNTNENKNRNQN
jgi:hypothetical protein